MAEAYRQEHGAERHQGLEQGARDAVALVARFGPDGVAWLDTFLANYVFPREPLDRVMLRARELAGLSPRPEDELRDDD